MKVGVNIVLEIFFIFRLGLHPIVGGDEEGTSRPFVEFRNGGDFGCYSFQASFGLLFYNFVARLPHFSELLGLALVGTIELHDLQDERLHTTVIFVQIVLSLFIGEKQNFIFQL